MSFCITNAKFPSDFVYLIRDAHNLVHKPENDNHFNYLNSLDAGIQDSSTSISIVVKFEQRLLKEKKKMVMKVTNIYKHEIVDTRA